MRWAYVQYPWEVMLEQRLQWGLLPGAVLPDDGFGLVVEGDGTATGVRDVYPVGQLCPEHQLDDRRIYQEIPGPSFKEDGLRHTTFQFEGRQTIVEYDKMKSYGLDERASNFHDLLTNQLLECSDRLYERRREAKDRWLEISLHEHVIDFLSAADDDFAPRTLLAEIALELPRVISAIISQPRKVLRRNHAQVQMDRLQEMDTNALMDYARRPGNTAALKAGERQRLMAVIREETADTLENRVVFDFCRRAAAAGRRFLKEICPCNKPCPQQLVRTCPRSKRIPRIEGFVRACEVWLMSAEMAGVQKLRTPCRIPNYVLLQNVRYMKVWDYYQRMLRQEDIKEQTWQWKRRAWSEHVRLLMMNTMEHLSLNGTSPVFRATNNKPFRVRKDPQFGRWLKPEPFPGSFVFEHQHGGYVSVHLFNRENVDRFLPNLGYPLAALNADLYWILASSSDSPDWKVVRVVPVWCLVGDKRWDSRAEELKKCCLADIKEAAVNWEKRNVLTTQEPRVRLARLLLIRAASQPGTDVTHDRGGSADCLTCGVGKASANSFKDKMNELLNEVAS